MMNNLNQGFSKSIPASPEEVSKVESSIGVNFPSSYKQFLFHINGGEGNIGEKGYIVLWPVEQISSNIKNYEFEKMFPSYIPIGSNGGGEAFVIKFSGNYATFGYIPFMDLNDENFVEIDKDFWKAIDLIGQGKAFGD
jgi:hypothetical protein